MIWNQHGWLLITRFNGFLSASHFPRSMSLWFWPLADLGQFFGLSLWCFLSLPADHWFEILCWLPMTRSSSCFSSIFLRQPGCIFDLVFVTLSGQYVLINPLFPFVHNWSRLFCFYSFWVLKFWLLWIILSSLFRFFELPSSHYLAVTDLRLLADCRWLVFHQPFFVDVSCIFDPVLITFWPIRFDHRSVSLCP